MFPAIIFIAAYVESRDEAERGASHQVRFFL